jgi:hypothetical protein
MHLASLATAFLSSFFWGLVFMPVNKVTVISKMES